MPRSHVTGGKVLANLIRSAKRDFQTPKLPVVTLGFHDPAVSAVAAVHEFGAGRVPERPAFRPGIMAAEREWKQALKAGEVFYFDRGAKVMRFDEAKLKALAKRCLKIVQDHYDNVQGPALSERQRQRKEGTPGAGRLLVGHEGPKLRERLEVFIDGVKVG